jgi:hypothetical protein
MLNFSRFLFLIIIFSCNSKTNYYILYKNSIQKKFHLYRDLSLNKKNKTFQYFEKSGLFMGFYHGKYYENDSLIILLNKNTYKNCFYDFKYKINSDSLNINFMSLRNDTNMGGILFVKNKTDSILFKKIGISFYNLKIDKCYLENENKIIFNGLYFNKSIVLDKNFNYYLVLFDDKNCDKKNIISENDSIVFFKKIKGKLINEDYIYKKSGNLPKWRRTASPSLRF